MSYPQLGYPYSSAPQFLMASSSLTACCESSHMSITEPGMATTSPRTPVYCPVYDSRLLATARHELSSGGGLGVYGNPCTSGQPYGNYFTYGADASTFISLGALETKDDRTAAPAGIPHTAAYHPYDSTLAQCQYDKYIPMDAGARRRNTTRETTSTLKAWLHEHRKNPYPTKGEKIMLAIITKMTLTQVSTWFANARRRLKKENKMTWPPRTKTSEERGCDDDEDEDGYDQMKSKNKVEEHQVQKDKDIEQSSMEEFHSVESGGRERDLKHHFLFNCHVRKPVGHSDSLQEAPVPLRAQSEGLSKICLLGISDPYEHSVNDGKTTLQGYNQILANKPKIWSLAQTVASLNPTEYPSCMYKCTSTLSRSSECYTSRTGTEKKQDCPVATLRSWVDGIFHEPLFQSSPNHSLTNTSLYSTTTKSTAVESEAVELESFNLLKSVKIK